jgi:hypothetical protein
MPQASIVARTENLSENGLLLYSKSLIPKGSLVELTVDAAPEPLLLSLHGEVLRVHPQPCGEFAIAIRCDIPFRLVRPTP